MKTAELEVLLDKLGEYVSWAMEAHQAKAKSPKDKVRFWDGKTPYSIHPLWCAMTLLYETKLPDEVRIPGAVTLLMHDVLEDTTAGLPEDLPEQVVEWVGEMTYYGGLVEEMEKIWEKPKEIILLKLYDKVSTLMDCVWMKPEQLEEYLRYTKKLQERVRGDFGELNIVLISEAMIAKWEEK